MKKILAITLSLIFAFSGCITLAYADDNYTCDVCGTSYETEDEYDAHLAELTEENIKCLVCETEFKTECAYNKHLVIDEDADVVCADCGFSYKNECALAVHRSVDNENPVVCAHCKNSYESVCAYNKHLVDDIDGESKSCPDSHVLECPYCDYKTKNEGSYNSHLSKSCPGLYGESAQPVVIYVCHNKDNNGVECGATFESKSEYQNHLDNTCPYRNLKINTGVDGSVKTVLTKVLETITKLLDKLGGIEKIVIKIIELLGKGITAILGLIIK